MDSLNMEEIDKKDTVERYYKRFQEFGYSPKTLGWMKGKQDIRFDVLTSMFDCNGKTVLDIGCGFGDLNRILERKFTDFHYVGCDLCDFLVDEGKKKYPGAVFYQGDFLSLNIKEQIDFAIASGPFNHIFNGGESMNYTFIKAVMEKAFSMLSPNGALAFDFMSNKVDFHASDVFYASQEKILSFSYELSRRVILRNDYMPFEFSVFVFKNDTFDKEDTLFRSYKKML